MRYAEGGFYRFCRRRIVLERFDNGYLLFFRKRIRRFGRKAIPRGKPRLVRDGAGIHGACLGLRGRRAIPRDFRGERFNEAVYFSIVSS